MEVRVAELLAVKLTEVVEVLLEVPLEEGLREIAPVALPQAETLGDLLAVEVLVEVCEGE